MNEAASRRAALIAMTLIAFATPFMLSGVNVALPTIGAEFGASALTLSWLSTSYSLATAVLMLPFGKVADIVGRKRIFLIGVAAYTIASALSALAPSVIMLLIFRIIQGCGAALIFGTSTAILTSVYPPEERGRVLGINVAAVYGGMSVGPLLGGLLVQGLGWRSVFWFNVPLGLITLAFTLWRVKGEWAGSPDDPFDLAGSAIYAVAVVALMIGFSSLPALKGALLILAGVAAGAAFLWRERRASHPVLELSLFRGNRVFVLSNIAALINYSATASISFLLSMYLQYNKGMSPSDAGIVLIAQPIMQTIFSPLAGRLSDRVETRIVASVGMACTAAGLVLLAFLSAATPLAYIIGALLLLGLGFGFFSSPNTNAIMSSVERRYYGVASGMVGTMRTFGQMLSMGIAMILFALFIGQAEITPEHYGRFLLSARTAFTIAAGLCALGVAASLARGKGKAGGGGGH